jgi:hypothetical protein
VAGQPEHGGIINNTSMVIAAIIAPITADGLNQSQISS